MKIGKENALKLYQMKENSFYCHTPLIDKIFT